VVVEYTHQELDQEVTAIGGRYVMVKEVRLPFRGREVLYLVGHAAFDTACCGAGGCAYALVPGFIVHWKSRVNQDGLAVSQVKPIHDKGVQEQLWESIRAEETVHEVRFL
jgi:hypothetical protein